MLFNALSVILIWIVIYIIAYNLCVKSKDNDLKEDPFKYGISIAGLFTLVFMWVMSWQNWWR